MKHAERHLDIIRLEQEQLSGDEMDLDGEMEENRRAYHEIGAKVKAAGESVEKIRNILSLIKFFSSYLCYTSYFLVIKK